MKRKKLSFLKNKGFQHSGDWQPDAKLKSGIRFHLHTMAGERVIYTFVVRSIPMYIGICDKPWTTLEERLKRYQSKAGGGTNRRVAGYIKLELGKRKMVRIYSWNPRTEFLQKHKGIRCDPVRGFEYPLIDAVKPKWNQ
jgi:hypothetical protein